MKRSRKTSALASLCLLLGVASSVGAETQIGGGLSKAMDQTKPDHVENIWLKNGILASVKAVEFTDEDAVRLEKFSPAKTDSFTDGDFHFEYRSRELVKDPAYPTIVLLSGLEGHLDGRFTRATLAFLSEMGDYNVLGLEALTSSPSLKKNGFVSLGGLHESVQIEHALDRMAREGKLPNKRVVIVAGSTSTFGAFHAQKLLRDRGYDIQSSLIIAGYNEITPILRLICRADYKDEQCAGNSSKFHFAFKLLSKKFFKRISELYYEGEDFAATYADYRPTEDYVGLYDLHRVSFEKHRADLERIYRRIYGVEMRFNDVFDYYLKLSLSRHAAAVRQPLLWLHAKDDPMAKYKDQLLPFAEAASSNPNVVPYLLKQGGHGAYSRLYGREWMVRTVRTFLDETK